ncbi:unnamed protein product [Durusdinium trenchii]|uniref:Uncharacterized protein n=1 Tax=Durusdinium trenchii TaxID=1381693 RepID=A0ABP0P3X5_9DINO
MGCNSSAVAVPEAVVAVESLDDGLDRLPELSVSQPLHAPDDAAASTGQKSHFEDEPRVPMASPEREARDAKSEALRVTKPSPTVSVKSGGALSANASPFRLSVFSTSTDRSLPGDSAFLWGSPQVLFQRFQQQAVRGESLYDSDDEHSGSHRRRGATAFGALGSDLPFLKWSEPHRFRERRGGGLGFGSG